MLAFSTSPIQNCHSERAIAREESAVCRSLEAAISPSPLTRSGASRQDKVLIMSPKKKSAYTVPKLKDFSAATSAESRVEKLLAALEAESKAVDRRSRLESVS